MSEGKSMTIDDLIKKYTEGCFLEIEEFDLKKYYLKVMAEDREIKNNAIKRWLRYEKTNTVDLDGCGKGSRVNIFSREVYERLWEFNFSSSLF